MDLDELILVKVMTWEYSKLDLEVAESDFEVWESQQTVVVDKTFGIASK